MRHEKTLLIAAIVLLLAVMLAVSMNRGEFSFIVDVVLSTLSWGFAVFAAWRATTAMNYCPFGRIVWVTGVLLPFVNVLVLGELYDRCNRSIEVHRRE